MYVIQFTTSPRLYVREQPYWGTTNDIRHATRFATAEDAAAEAAEVIRNVAIYQISRVHKMGE